ncbi:MAG TPA: MFS transporter [Mycobacterium sp.]|nr:MFS transporter [Mycobacterium sp.]
MRLRSWLPPVPPEPDFRRLISSRLLTSLGSAATPVLLVLTVLGGGGDAGELGLVLSLGALPGVLCLFVSGVGSDRSSRRRLVLGADLLNATAAAVAAGSLLAGERWTAVMVAVAMITSVTFALLYPAYGSLFASTLARDHLQQANALRGLIASTTMIAGPALAGISVSVLPIAVPWVVVTALFLCGALLVTRVRTTGAPPPPTETVWHQITTGWRYFWSERWLRNLTAFSAVWHMLVWAPLLVLGPIILAGHYGGAGQWGWFQAAVGVGGVATTLVAGRLRVRRMLLAALGGLVLVGAATLGLALRAPLLVVLVGAAVVGVGLAVADVFWISAMQAWIPDDKIGQMLSYDYLVSVALLPFGYALAPVLADIVGACQVLLFGLGVTTVVAAVIAVGSDVAHRSLVEECPATVAA